MRVALVVMPLAAIDRPSLAAGLFQAELRRRGIECDTKHFNVTLASMLGPATYKFLAQDACTTALAGEWAFSQAYFGQRFSTWESYSREVLDVPVWGLNAADRPSVLALRDVAPAFLRVALESNDWSRYDLVAFTSTFEQTMPSLALARMIRARHPGVLIAAGGANFESGMGRPYMDGFEFLDFISTGEGDVSFPLLCERLRDARGSEVDVPPGFLYRRGGEVRESPRDRSAGFARLDELATPDYADYFRVLGATFERGVVAPWLPVEASRGCWWGERAHCTFCGLNGDAMTFRKKSFARIVEETDELARRHGPVPLQFADNILGMGYFADLLPFWAQSEARVFKFFEIKSNLQRYQVKLLRDAGIRTVQAGVESLSDETLRIMQKGVSAAQNVAVLRWCQEYGIEGLWNVIFGFPREDPASFGATLAVLEKMTHMLPPSACAPIRMDRYSPNHSSYREQGFTRIEPMPAYRHVFPFAEEALSEMAYYFRYEHPRYDEMLERGRELFLFVKRWQAEHARGAAGELSVKAECGGHVLVDTRFNFAPSRTPLGEADLAILAACDAPTSPAGGLRKARGRAPEGELASSLASLLARGAVAEVGAHVVTLAMLPVDLVRDRPADRLQTVVQGG